MTTKLLALASVLMVSTWVVAQQPAAPQAPAASVAASAQPATAASAAKPSGSPGLAAPGWNNPPKWESVDRSSAYVSVKGRETDVLIQGAGHEWRKFRNGPLTTIGGWLLLIIPALILVFYFVKGAIPLKAKPTGKLVQRFSEIERVTHWTMAISFVVLALSGIVILFGKYLLIPVIGHKGNALVTAFAKNLHNFIGPLFVFAIVVAFFLFVRDNVWKRHDWDWLSKAGGLLSGAHVPSGRFNAGEKIWFWIGLVVLGVAMGVSGLVMNFPNWNQGREVMQTMNIVHAVGAVMFIALSMGHIYMGTIGMKGAYSAMRTGYVDEAWLKEHHELAYEEIKEVGNAPAAGTKAQLAAGD